MQRPPARQIPDSSGAYLFRDVTGRVIYVGKAKSLRKRISSYFVGQTHPRTRAMLDTAETVEWILAQGETSALMLEYSLIKEHEPQFNVRLKDDKSYPYLMITSNETWPRAAVVRGKKRAGADYFGPYGHAFAIRRTLDQLLRNFPVRTCSDGVFRRQESQGRPCLLFHIEKCSGPCIGAVEPEAYQAHVSGLARFLRGEGEGVVSDLERAMWKAAEDLEYETAGRLRDRLEAVRRVLERQEVVSAKAENLDVLAVFGDDLETSVQVLKVRNGRVVGRWGSVVDRVEVLSDDEFIDRIVAELYIDEAPPPVLLVPISPAEPAALSEFLSVRRGGPVKIRVPERGGKRRLMESATANARGAFESHRLRRRADYNARARALQELQEVIGLVEAPLRIEAFDISTLQGTETVASMVVMEDGLPQPSSYRRFRIRTVAGQDDFASMEETIRRRFQAYLDEVSGSRKGDRFRYPPGLVVIDGGIGQLGRAVKVLDELGLDIPVIGLAKRLEEVYLPGAAEPLVIPRDSEALYLLQHIRDEAHRFAITYHRNLRSKSMVDSVLDAVPGVGSERKRALIKRFGSIKRIRAASIEELSEVVPRKTAEAIYASLHSG